MSFYVKPYQRCYGDLPEKYDPLCFDFHITEGHLNQPTWINWLPMASN